MPRAKSVKPAPHPPKSPKSALHRLSVSTKASGLTTDSDATRIALDDALTHSPSASKKDQPNLAVEEGIADDKLQVRRRLIYDIILAKIEQGNKCDWFALSEKLKVNQDTTHVDGKKGRKGKKTLEAVSGGAVWTGTELHDIFYNTILPALVSGADLFRPLSPPAPADEPVTQAKSAKTSKKRNIDDLGSEEGIMGSKAVKAKLVKKSKKMRSENIMDGEESKENALKVSKKTTKGNQSKEEIVNTESGKKKVDDNMKDIVREFIGEVDSDEDDPMSRVGEGDMEYEEEEIDELEDDEANTMTHSQMRTESWIRQEVDRLGDMNDVDPMMELDVIGGGAAESDAGEDHLDVMDEEIDSVMAEK